jgi:hypothetical protein
MAKSFEAEVRRHAHIILNGTVLAIDPASGGSSLPGWAAISKSKMIKSGTLPIPPGPVQDRLREVYEQLETTDPDVLVIERIRGSSAHEHLRWSVGVCIAACRPVILLEMPISTWKKYAGKNHKKGDENDARAIGEALIAIALGKAAS